MIDLKIFSTQHCPPCIFATQVAYKMRREFPDLQVTEVDLSEQPEMAMKYQIFAAPGIVINKRLEFRGGVNEKQLKEKLWNLSHP